MAARLFCINKIMYYIIYKTTNLLNNMIYIGSHQTANLNDGYLGSGKYLKKAIKKYGKEILSLKYYTFFLLKKKCLAKKEK